MPTTLLLIRHGQTPWNALGRIQGCNDIELEKEGELQAQLLSERLNGRFSAIYTSPLKRAYKTAEILAAPTHLTIEVDDALCEINFGLWEGLTFKEVADQYPNELTLWHHDEKEGPLCGGDGSLKNVSLRAKACILNMINAHPNETIVAVSHGGLIKAALLGLFNLQMTMYHHMAMGNTSLTTIRFTDELKPILLGLNDTSHLSNLEKEARCI